MRLLKPSSTAMETLRLHIHTLLDETRLLLGKGAGDGMKNPPPAGGAPARSLRDPALEAVFVAFAHLLLRRMCAARRVTLDWQHVPHYATAVPLNTLAGCTGYRDLQAHLATCDPARLAGLAGAGTDSMGETETGDVLGTLSGEHTGRSDKRRDGQYYTPLPIVRYILDGVGFTTDALVGTDTNIRQLVDPACGSGLFLIEAARRLGTTCPQTGSTRHNYEALVQRMQHTLVGCDSDPFACFLAQVNLTLHVLYLLHVVGNTNEHLPAPRFAIHCANALTKPPCLPMHQFACVVGNPPYGAALSNHDKAMLRETWPDICYGQPDTYTFFLKLGAELLAPGGRLGYIVPNTFLAGTTTAPLRRALLDTGRVEEIVDLPGGVWNNARVDCVLFFLAAEASAQRRQAQQVPIHVLHRRDSLPQLEQYQWNETRTQPQAQWMAHPTCEIAIRHDTLLERIEAACCVPAVHSESDTTPSQVLRLGDVSRSSQGIIPYKTRDEGRANRCIRPASQVPPDAPEWKPLLDGHSTVGRYTLHWNDPYPYIHYGEWLWCQRDPVFFESPKLLVQAMRHRSLRRRLVATYDEQQFYNRHNYHNIIAADAHLSPHGPGSGPGTFNLKYLLALINSSLMNAWYRCRFDNVNINLSHVRQMPVFPADAATQAEIAALVDRLLAAQAALSHAPCAGNAGNAAALHEEIALLDTQLDRRVFALYGCTEEEQQQMVGHDVA